VVADEPERELTVLPATVATGRLGRADWLGQGGPSALDGLVHHSDQDGQHLAIRYTQRLADAGAVTSVGSAGDVYDNALAENTIGLYKTELIRRRGPWRALDDPEPATVEWVDWYNQRRLHGALDYLPLPGAKPPTILFPPQP
jgi:putative transposase